MASLYGVGMELEGVNPHQSAGKRRFLLAALVLVGGGLLGFVAFGGFDRSSKRSTASTASESLPSSSQDSGASGSSVDSSKTAGVALLKPAAFESRRIQGSVLVNVHVPFEGDLEGTDLSIPFDEIAARTADLPSDKDTPLLVYCRSGRMSAIAGKELVRLGYRNVVDLEGGMIAWEASGRSITAAQPAAAQAPKPAGSKGGFTGGDFHSLVADPVTAGRVFVGGHQAVSVSVDSGASWAEVRALANADAMGWSFSGGAVWVSGHPGIVKSTDDTNTVEQRNAGLPDTDIHALGGAGNTLYAAGPAVGVLKSVDDGVTWTAATTSVGQSFFGRILVNPADVNHIVAADPSNGVLTSNDGGATWKQLTAAPASWVSSPDGLKTLYASGVQGAMRSLDGGGTWSALALPESATMVEADPTTPSKLYAGAHDGERVRVWSSVDNGATWEAR